MQQKTYPIKAKVSQQLDAITVGSGIGGLVAAT